MTGPIYFGGLQVSSATDTHVYATDKEELVRNLTEQWKQEVRTVLKFIDDSKLEMPLMKEILSSASEQVLVQEYREHAA